MPSLVGTTVTANYLKAAPSTKFGTRELAFFLIDIASVEATPTASDSVFSKLIRAVQQVAEIYAVGTPSSDGVVFVLSEDTTPDSANTGDSTPTQAERLAVATGAVVTKVALVGNALA